MKSLYKSFDIDETEAEVAWLNQRSAEGLTLTFAPQLGGIYWFAEGDPKRYVYAIDLKPKGYYRDPERRAFLEETGWELLGRTVSGLVYLRRPAELAGAATLYSDPESRAELLRELRRKVLVSVTGAAAIIVWNGIALATAPELTAFHWTGSLVSTAVMGTLIVSILRRRARLGRRIEELAA